jgi:hypothetical protein
LQHNNRPLGDCGDISLVGMEDTGVSPLSVFLALGAGLALGLTAVSMAVFGARAKADPRSERQIRQLDAWMDGDESVLEKDF